MGKDNLEECMNSTCEHFRSEEAHNCNKWRFGLRLVCKKHKSMKAYEIELLKSDIAKLTEALAISDKALELASEKLRTSSYDFDDCGKDWITILRQQAAKALEGKDE